MTCLCRYLASHPETPERQESGILAGIITCQPTEPDQFAS